MLGSGTLSNPYQITNRSELESIVNDYSVHYMLMNDINLSDADWIPFPMKDASGGYFVGSLDGNGKKILNMKIFVPSGSVIRAGLFEFLYQGSVIKRLGIENIDILSNYHYVGGLTGQSNGATIEESYVTGKIVIQGNSTFGGGLIGNALSGTVVADCYTNVSIKTGMRGGHGGFVGRPTSTGTASPNDTKFTRCLVFGSIDGSTCSWNEVGGFYGSTSTANGFAPLFSNCYFDYQKAGTSNYLMSGLGKKTTVEMQSSSFFGLSTSTWNLVEGQYPSLKAFAPKSLIETKTVTSHVNRFLSDKVLNKVVTKISVASVRDLDSSLQKQIKSTKTNTTFMRDIVSGSRRSVQVVKVANEIVTSYILPITTDVKTLTRQVKSMTATVTSHVDSVATEVYKKIKSLRQALSFIDLIVGRAVTPDLKPKQIEVIVNHMENGTLSEYLSSQYNLSVYEDLSEKKDMQNISNVSVLENTTLVEVMD